MSAEPSYSKWPLRIRVYQGNWSISYHDSNGKIIHLMSATGQIEAFRAADKLAILYHHEGEVMMQSDMGNQLVDIHKVMHFRN